MPTSGRFFRTKTAHRLPSRCNDGGRSKGVESARFVIPSGSVPTYVQKAWRLEFASGHGKKLIAKSIS